MQRVAISILAVLLLAIGATDSVAQGLKAEDPTAYRSFARAPLHRAFLPIAVDLSHAFPTPGDQGDQGSCVGWAVGYAARSFYVLEHEGGNPGNASDIVSPSFIYNTINDQPGNCENGTRISDALELLRFWGALSIAEAPYLPRSCNPPSEVAAEALQRFQIWDWRTVDYTRLDDIKGQLAKGHPVIFGAALTYDFDDMRDATVYHGSGEEWGSSHAMVLVGYDDMRQAFKLINSWGKRWGEGGFGWIAYDTFAARANSAFVVEPSAGQRPEPDPEPAPVPEPDVAVVVPEPGPGDIDPPLETYACAELHANIVNGRLVVSGFVASRGDLAQLQVSLAGRDAVLRVAVHEWPQCEALMTFRQQMAEGGGPEIRIVAGKTEFARGETLVLEVTTPSYPSYLYLSYIQASGEVVHLVQPSGPVPSPLPAGQTLTFGDGLDGRTRFVVTPPFGNEMIIALAAASPLFAQPRPGVEIERDYLTAFRDALVVKPIAGVEPRRVRGSYATLSTRDAGQ